MNKYPRSDIEAKNFLDCRLPSPLSVLEHSPFAESCNSSEIADSMSEGGKELQYFKFPFISILHFHQVKNNLNNSR